MPDVAMLRWPSDEPRRVELAVQGRPRLLLVDAEVPPPAVTDALEDWVRLPASAEDVRARVRGLEMRTADCQPVRPWLDDDGVLHAGSERVVLPPVEARLAAELVPSLGSVVSREVLARAGWPDGLPSRNLLDVRILRLRRRLATVGLALRTVRHRGYLLEVDPGVSDPVQLADTDR